MNAISEVPNDLHGFIAPILLPDLEVSWVGPTAVEGVLCFGSEDGRIRFADIHGKTLGGMRSAVRSGEAVNGVAFINSWMMVSSRDEAILWTLPTHTTGQTMVAPVPLGAHGVIASESGYFFAPLGMKGFLFCHPRSGEIQSFNISSGPSNTLCFYRMISYRAANGQEVIASALRRGGLGVMEFNGEGHRHVLNTQSFSGLDVVDVCSVQFQGVPGIAAIGKDRTLILLKGKNLEPTTIRYEAIEGVAYRILCARNYLFVLTSKALYVIQDLISDVVAGQSHNTMTNVMTLAMEAVDASLVGDRWLFIVLPDEVLRLDVSLLQFIPSAEDAISNVSTMRMNKLDPHWEGQKVEMEVRQSPLAA